MNSVTGVNEVELLLHGMQKILHELGEKQRTTKTNIKHDEKKMQIEVVQVHDGLLAFGEFSEQNYFVSEALYGLVVMTPVKS